MQNTLKAEITPQIYASDSLVVGQLPRQTFFEHLALVDDLGPVADAQGFPDVVVRIENAQATAPPQENQVLNVAHGQRVDSGARLVKVQEDGRQV